jgi:hypothetical protein
VIVRYPGSALWLVVALAACAPPREPAPPTSPAAVAADANAPAVTRRPLPEAVPVPSPGAAAPKSAPMPAIVVPASAVYVCVVGSGTTTITQTAIEYVDKVDALCRKHPEMGPCQYERNACRRKGGRVFAADGSEITMATEAEYDKKVHRVQFRAN